MALRRNAVAFMGVTRRGRRGRGGLRASRGKQDRQDQKASDDRGATHGCIEDGPQARGLRPFSPGKHPAPAWLRFKRGPIVAPPVATRPQQSYGLLLAVQLLFGLFPVVAFDLLQTHGGPLNPFSVLAIRVGGAAFCLLALHLVLVKNPIPIRKEFPRVFWLALLGVVLNMGMFMVGLQYTDPTEAVLVITTIPVFTYAIAVLLGREQLGPRRAIGIALGVGGVVYLTLNNATLGDHAHVVGDLLILGNAISYAAFLVLAKPLIEKYDALSLITWVFLIGTLVFVPLGLMQGLRGEIAALDLADLGRLAFIVFGASVATYVFNTIALRHVPASTVAIFTYVQPVFTAIFAWILLDHRLSLAILPAAALIFAGVWLVARRNPKVLEGELIGE